MNHVTIRHNGMVLSTDDSIQSDIQLTKNELETLLREPGGNAAKEFMAHGDLLHGDRQKTHGMIRHPYPASISSMEMLYNLALYGYEMITIQKVHETRIIRPEYVVVNAVYNFDMRHLTSGMPVVLAKAPIIWGLMKYEAARYHFSEILLGVLTELDKYDAMPSDARRTMLALQNENIIAQPCSDLPKTMRTYEIRFTDKK